MNNFKETRLIINKIDARLGSVEKELKFDKIAIFTGLGLAIICATLIFLFVDRHPILSLFLVLLLFFGLCIAYTMAKEYFDDLKRFKSQQKD